jgi:hypothetical protein
MLHARGLRDNFFQFWEWHSKSKDVEELWRLCKGQGS